ncbi:hypothetical protein CALCODRAFT_155334 [Calocera cornea HHB12733]|uniref:Uncharacterized protein n=1 Tax=Calocera cornea HHB12733 TaxID=1353952 RepID=A0A165CLC8_9BASI|nr:hypothetical protein CALCODRAFT_155334 [Calocera cornea HHB12733]
MYNLDVPRWNELSLFIVWAAAYGLTTMFVAWRACTDSGVNNVWIYTLLLIHVFVRFSAFVMDIVLAWQAGMGQDTSSVLFIIDGVLGGSAHVVLVLVASTLLLRYSTRPGDWTRLIPIALVVSLALYALSGWKSYRVLTDASMVFEVQGLRHVISQVSRLQRHVLTKIRTIGATIDVIVLTIAAINMLVYLWYRSSTAIDASGKQTMTIVPLVRVCYPWSTCPDFAFVARRPRTSHLFVCYEGCRCNK